MTASDSIELAKVVISALTLFLACCGAAHAFVKWKRSLQQSRSVRLRIILNEFNKNEMIQNAYSCDNVLETWADFGLEEGSRRTVVEKTLNLISYICYLRKNGQMDTDEFIFFKDTIDRILSADCMNKFLTDEYKSQGEKNSESRYYHVFSYMRENGIPVSPAAEPIDQRTFASNETNGPIAMKEFTRPTMIIKISRAYNTGMSDDDIREATQGWWRITPEKANRTDLILAVANGMVMGVYRRNGPWQKDEVGDHDGRYRFDGKTADDAEVRKFKDRSVANLFPKGASNPIRYFFPNQQS